MKRTIKFDLFPQKVNGVLTDSRPIRMRVTYACQRVDLRIGYSVEVSKWNEAEQRAITGTKNRYKQTASEINKAILVSEEKIDEIFSTYERTAKRVPTPEELKQAFDDTFKRTKPKMIIEPFFDIFDKFTRTMGQQNGWSEATYKRFDSLRILLWKYNSGLLLETLTEETMQDFVQSLNKRELRNTTIAKTLSMMRWFLRWASRKGYYTGMLHETFKPKLKGTDGNSKEVIYLEWEELMHLYDFTFPPEHAELSEVRDVFCFCCFSGLRYSDVAKLRRSDESLKE